jgi:hypothetical protein
LSEEGREKEGSISVDEKTEKEEDVVRKVRTKL